MAIYSDALFDNDDLISIINAMRISDGPSPSSTTSPHPRPSAVTPPVQPIGTSSTSGSHALSQTDNRIYDVSSGRETGTIEDWSRAAHATRGVPGGRARRIVDRPTIDNPSTPQPHHSRTASSIAQSPTQATPVRSPATQVPSTPARTPAITSNASSAWVNQTGNISSTTPTTSLSRCSRRQGRTYVVFEGVAPGIYATWNEVKPLVTGIPGNVHESFAQHIDAEKAYVLAYAMGSVRVLKHPNDPTPGAPVAAAPMPETIMSAWAAADANFLEGHWHVVFKGKCPGLFPSWNFAAMQTSNVSRAVYQSYPSKAEAQAAYDRALERGEVEVL